MAGNKETLSYLLEVEVRVAYKSVRFLRDLSPRNNFIGRKLEKQLAFVGATMSRSEDLPCENAMRDAIDRSSAPRLLSSSYRTGRSTLVIEQIQKEETD
eukprot:scaffold3237_cov55-Attheya_sp.AAC.1